MKNLMFLLSFIIVSFIPVASKSQSTLWLDELDLSEVTTGWGNASANKSVQQNPLTIAGKTYLRGVGTHATSTLSIDLSGCDASKFEALVGVDDEVKGEGSVIFFVVSNNKILWKSGKMKKGNPVKRISVNLKGIDKLGLLVTDAGDGVEFDHANWVDAKIIYVKHKPLVLSNKSAKDEYILTPETPLNPKINGPKIYGVRPGSPFLYRIPATGERPIKFTANNLPSGLNLDDNSGIISGKLLTEGKFEVNFNAENSLGKDSRKFTIVVGNTLALTPPMGWNSWYIHYNRVTDSLMRQAADQMINSGMADYGYQYVNIDDCWMVKSNSDDPILGGKTRDENGKLLTNKTFPDMKGLSDYIHSKGLKAGLYISPGPRTCAGYAGSYQHEALDAKTFAGWGFDFLKYDWCSYGEIAKSPKGNEFIAPYSLMWNELQKQNRDIVFNLCQYGMGNVWEWGAQVGNCWRTTGDLGLESGKSMPGFYKIGMSNAKHWQYAKPGAWNDPDYILIGWVGAANEMAEGTKTKLLPDEQYFYMSMWSLMASPLIFSGDMARLDPFQLNILCNSEVININQDVLGKQAFIFKDTDDELIMIKDLEDGSKAVGLFYPTNDAISPLEYFQWNQKSTKNISISAQELGFKGKMKIRDVWRQKDLGEFENSFTAEVTFHGVVLLKISE